MLLNDPEINIGDQILSVKIHERSIMKPGPKALLLAAQVKAAQEKRDACNVERKWVQDAQTPRHNGGKQMASQRLCSLHVVAALTKLKEAAQVEIEAAQAKKDIIQKAILSIYTHSSASFFGVMNYDGSPTFTYKEPVCKETTSG